MQNLLNLDTTLSDSNRLELVDAIQELVLPDTPETEKRKIKALELFKSKAPNAYRAAQPILMPLLSAVIQKALGFG